MIHFLGAGPGAEDLITVRGQRYLEQAGESGAVKEYKGDMRDI
jgi:precorrin-2 methylase